MHFLNINVNTLLSKNDELRDVVGCTKPAILGTTESKLDISVSDQKGNIGGCSLVRSDRNKYGGSVTGYVRTDLCFNTRNAFQIQLKMFF